MIHYPSWGKPGPLAPGKHPKYPGAQPDYFESNLFRSASNNTSRRHSKIARITRSLSHESWKEPGGAAPGHHPGQRLVPRHKALHPGGGLGLMAPRQHAGNAAGQAGSVAPKHPANPAADHGSGRRWRRVTHRTIREQERKL